MWNKKFVYILDLKKFKAVPKNNHSPQQQQQKVLLTTAAYFKVSTPVMLQRQ